MQAMILAAGFGTRLRPYTNLRPKPLFPVLNRPLLLFLLDMLERAGCDRIVVNAHHLADQICAAVADRKSARLQVEPEILGTGGSLRAALPWFDDRPILVMNGDIVHDIDVTSLYRAHCLSEHLVTMALHDLPRFNGVSVSGSRIVSFNPEQRGTKLAYTGVQVVDPVVIEQIPRSRFFHIIDLYEKLAPEGVLGAWRVDGCFWRDIGTPRDYLELHQDLLASPELFKYFGVPSDRIRGGWLIGRQSVVEPGARLKGWGCLGNRCMIRQPAMLERCVVWDRAVISGAVTLRDSIVTGAPDFSGECPNRS